MASLCAVSSSSKLEQISSFYSNPKIKGNAYVNYAAVRHNIRLGVHSIVEMQDVNHVLTMGVLAKEKAYAAVDLVYLVELP